MRACHKESHEIVAPQLPTFDAPELAIVGGPERIEVAIAMPIASPHPAPAPRRPDAPS